LISNMSFNEAKKETKINDELLPLSEASKISGYTPEYLNSLSRKGMLKAKKIGRNWHTTFQWLDDYLVSIGKKDKAEKSGEVFRADISGEKSVQETDQKAVSEMVNKDIEEKKFLTDKSEKLKIAGLPKKDNQGFFMKVMAGSFSALVVVPLIFIFIYTAKVFIDQRNFNLEKLALVNDSPNGIVFNENTLDGKNGKEEYSGEVRGEETSEADEQAKKSGILLASENFKANQVSLSGAVVLAAEDDNRPLEISDIKSESFVSAKKDNAGGSEEVKLVVSWKTNKLAMSEIEYSKNNGQDTKNLKEQSYGFNHAVVVTKINPRTSYTYSIKVRDHWGNEIDSGRYGVFTTSKPTSIFDVISEEINEIFGWAINR